MSEIVKVKMKNGEERTFYDVDIEGDDPNYWRLTLLQAGKIVFQSDKKEIVRWELVQKPG